MHKKSNVIQHGWESEHLKAEVYLETCMSIDY